jgi:TetR/AcrR family transcriptional repressor of nem operon
MGRTSDAREKLLAAALDLIWTSSYGGVSVDDICERARVNKGSFYHFFPSKSDLAVAAYEAHWQDKRPSMDALFSPQNDPLERIENWCRCLYEGQKEKFEQYGFVVGCPYANVGSELATRDPKIRAKTQEMLERGLRYLEGAIADAKRLGLIDIGDATAAAKQVSSCILGLLVQAKIDNNPELLRELEPTIMRLLGARTALA